MFRLKGFIDGYVKASFHVALMVVCFFEMTLHQWEISTSVEANIFIFCLAFLGYNGIKYYPFSQYIDSAPLLLPLGSIALLYAFYYAFFLPLSALLLLFFCGLLCIAYAVPLPSSRRNLRSRFGVKIFIVALCWTLLTAVFPLIYLTQWNIAHYHFFMERFVLVFVATLPFEIRDSTQDQLDLGTIPQLIGLKRTRLLGAVLLVVVFGIKLFVLAHQEKEIVAFGILGVAYLLALFKVSPGQSENITLFWVEFIPVLGWLYFYLNSI